MPRLNVQAYYLAQMEVIPPRSRRVRPSPMRRQQYTHIRTATRSLSNHSHDAPRVALPARVCYVSEIARKQSSRGKIIRRFEPRTSQIDTGSRPFLPRRSQFLRLSRAAICCQCGSSMRDVTLWPTTAALNMCVRSRAAKISWFRKRNLFHVESVYTIDHRTLCHLQRAIPILPRQLDVHES